MIKIVITAMALIAAIAISHAFAAYVAADVDGGAADEELLLYSVYKDRYDSVRSEFDIAANGFNIDFTQTFAVDHITFGKIWCVPTIDTELNRLALFFTQDDGSIVYKTDDFESNSWLDGKARQTNRKIDCISFRDLDGDGLMDIIVISQCKNDAGMYSARAYRVGDALFQNEAGFYRDHRVSDKINRFDMNKDYLAV
jgi:hypothetical protein